MKRRFFNYIVRDIAKVAQHRILPKWAIVLHWLLFPLLSFRYWFDAKHGYDIRTDVWNINGIKISGYLFDEIIQPGRKFEVIK